MALTKIYRAIYTHTEIYIYIFTSAMTVAQIALYCYNSEFFSSEVKNTKMHWCTYLYTHMHPLGRTTQCHNNTNTTL